MLDQINGTPPLYHWYRCMEPPKGYIGVGGKAVLQQAPEIAEFVDLHPVLSDWHGGVSGVAPSLGRASLGSS